jgi:hypothetical protein
LGLLALFLWGLPCLPPRLLLRPAVCAWGCSADLGHWGSSRAHSHLFFAVSLLYTVCGGWKNDSQHCPFALIFRTCNYVTSHGKRNFSDVTGTLRWNVIIEDPGEPLKVENFF